MRAVSEKANEDLGLVKIKCPFMLEKCSTKYFENSLSKSQVANVCLERFNSDQISLKRNHELYFHIS